MAKVEPIVLMDFLGDCMSDFFPTTKLATDALYGSFKLFVPYHDSSFHKEEISSFIAHVARAVWNAIKTTSRALVISLSLLNPLAWFGLPLQALELADNIAGLLVASLTVTLFPFIVAIRSLSTIFLGYGRRGTVESEEDADLELTFKIW
jgi:hypothetical protein